MSSMMTLDEIFAKRRSVRGYDARPVSAEALEALCEAARNAPSACNSQTWRFVVVTDPAMRERICSEAMLPVIPNRWLRTAPAIVVGCSQLDLLANRIGSAVTGIEYFQIDLGIAMEHMVLKATELGLGTCWIGWFREKKIRQLLGIPGSVRVSALLAVGHPAETGPAPPRSRRPLDEIAWFERWGRPGAKRA